MRDQLIDFGDVPQQGTLRVFDGKVNPCRDASVDIEQQMFYFLIGFQFSV
jgi:hypothetical protein